MLAAVNPVSIFRKHGNAWNQRAPPRHSPCKPKPTSLSESLGVTAKTLRHCDYSASKAAHNFAVLQKWNESEVYAKTVAHFANRLAKEP